MTLGALLRRGQGIVAEGLGINSRARRRLDGTRAALLYYHRVIPTSVVERDFVEPGMYVTPESFEQQLDWIVEHLRVLPLFEITQRLSAGESLPDGACALTFDDGWRDNHDFALPALARRQLPATIFVVTDRVGSDGAFWPDEVCRRLGSETGDDRRRIVRALGLATAATPVDDLLRHLKSLGEDVRAAWLDRLRQLTRDPVDAGRELMNWDEIAAASACGIDIESHGATHAVLSGLPPDEAARELRASRESLLARGYGQHGLLAYPSGGFDEAVMNIAREAGYRSAVTIEHGLAGPRDRSLALPRLCVHQGIVGSRGQFFLKTLGSA